MQDETPSIDPSQWLHASFHRVYPSQMGRVVERNGRYYAITPDRLFDFLYSEDILTPIHLSAAEFYVTLYEVATSKSGYAKMMNLLHNMGAHQGGEKLPGFCPNTLIMLISKQMQNWQYAMIERICLQPVRLNDLVWVKKYENSIRDSFQGLGRAIEISVDIMKSRLQDSKQ